MESEDDDDGDDMNQAKPDLHALGIMDQHGNLVDDKGEQQQQQQPKKLSKNKKRRLARKSKQNTQMS